MSHPNKRRGGIGFDREDEPEAASVCSSIHTKACQTDIFKKRQELDPSSADFLEGQNLYLRIRSELQAQLTSELEAKIRSSVTSKMKDEIRRGMILDIQEEGRKLLADQKKLIAGLRKEVRKEIEKELGLEPEREERLRGKVRREVREEEREGWERKVEDARRETRYEMEGRITGLEERVAELQRGKNRGGLECVDFQQA